MKMILNVLLPLLVTLTTPSLALQIYGKPNRTSKQAHRANAEYLKHFYNTPDDLRNVSADEMKSRARRKAKIAAKQGGNANAGGSN